MSLFLFISLKAEEARELAKKYAEEKGVRKAAEGRFRTYLNRFDLRTDPRFGSKFSSGSRNWVIGRFGFGALVCGPNLT